MSNPETTDEPASGSEDPDTLAGILKTQLDDHDYQIFEALNEDGRMSDTELADRVGLSRTAVRRRREKLVESGTLEILAVLVLQNADLAYADMRVSLNSEATADQRDKLIAKFIDADLVYSVDSVLGDYDLLVRGWHVSLGDLKSYFWKLLDDEPPVGDYEITPVVHTWKAWNRELDNPEKPDMAD